MAGTGPRATPTVSGSRVYAYGTSGILQLPRPARRPRALVAQHGQRSGRAGASIRHVRFAARLRQLGRRQSRRSPDKPDGTETSGHALVAYDRITGKQVWAGGDYRAAYASPILATIDGVRQVVIFDAVGAGGYDAKTGKELWRSPEWTNQFDNNCRPADYFGRRLRFF